MEKSNLLLWKSSAGCFLAWKIVHAWWNFYIAVEIDVNTFSNWWCSGSGRPAGASGDYKNFKASSPATTKFWLEQMGISWATSPFQRRLDGRFWKSRQIKYSIKLKVVGAVVGIWWGTNIGQSGMAMRCRWYLFNNDKTALNEKRAKLLVSIEHLSVIGQYIYLVVASAEIWLSEILQSCIWIVL